jgi:hypothetical protein
MPHGEMLLSLLEGLETLGEPFEERGYSSCVTP